MASNSDNNSEYSDLFEADAGSVLEKDLYFNDKRLNNSFAANLDLRYIRQQLQPPPSLVINGDKLAWWNSKLLHTLFRLGIIARRVHGKSVVLSITNKTEKDLSIEINKLIEEDVLKFKQNDTYILRIFRPDDWNDSCVYLRQIRGSGNNETDGLEINWIFFGMSFYCQKGKLEALHQKNIQFRHHYFVFPCIILLRIISIVLVLLALVRLLFQLFVEMK